MDGTKAIKTALKVVLAAIIFAAIFVFFCYFFQPVFERGTNHLSLRYFYDEPENSVETIILGASTVYYDISPMEMYEEYGISVYNLGASDQPVMLSYYWLEEAFRLHPESLKNVLFSVSGLRDEVDDSWYQLSSDGMNLSKVKFDAVSAYSDSTEDALIRLVPLLSYHDRWSEISEEDFEKFSYDRRTYLRGYFFNTFNVNFTTNTYDELTVPEYYPDFGEEEAELREESLEYFLKMVDFCEENDINLVLIMSPGEDLTDSEHVAVQNLADKYNLDFLDFNHEPYLSEMGYIEAVDRGDGSHLNYYGTKKYCSLLGKYLVENCNASDVRGKAGFEFMGEELQKYNEKVTDVMLLKDETDPAEYLKIALSNENYSVFIASEGDVSSALTDDQRKEFKDIGLEILSELESESPYIAVIDEGKVYEESEDTDLSYSGTLKDNTVYSLFGAAADSENTVSVMIEDSEESAESFGLNIVIYDNEMKEVVDSAVFDTGTSSERIGGNLEAALETALENADNYTELPEDLQKLYLYNIRCEDEKFLEELKDSAGDDWNAYLNGLMDNKNYAVFVTEKGSPYIAVYRGGNLSYEQSDTSPISISASYFPTIDGSTDILYTISSSADSSSVIINGTECSLDEDGINIVVWNVVTNLAAASVSFSS